MKIELTLDKSELNAQVIAYSGQIFLWDQLNARSYRIKSGEKSVLLTDLGDTTRVSFKEEEEAFWHRFFDGDRDYATMRKSLEKDPALKCAMEQFPGLRILRQDPYEVMLQFIVSANNNMKRIKGCVRALAECFGDRNAEGLYSLPKAERLVHCSQDELRSKAGVGYRAKAILFLARAIMEGDFIIKGAKELSDADLYQKLLSLYGVGPKVANCILLFGFHRMRAFPVDVWMERIMREKYDLTCNRKEIAEFGYERFYPYGGFAQQLLFMDATSAGKKI